MEKKIHESEGVLEPVAPMKSVKFPPELDVERYISESMASGVSPKRLALAVVKGFEGHELDLPVFHAEMQDLLNELNEEASF